MVVAEEERLSVEGWLEPCIYSHVCVCQGSHILLGIPIAVTETVRCPPKQSSCADIDHKPT